MEKDELIKTWKEMSNELEEAREALVDMVYHFAYHNEGHSGNREPSLHTGGLSVLEDAFDVLGIPDPCPMSVFAQINPLKANIDD